jgi:hypothetical protein
MCRSEMAESSDENEDEDDETEYETEDEDEDETENEENILRGFRFLFNNIYEEDITKEKIYKEQTVREMHKIAEEENIILSPHLPSVDFIYNKLLKSQGELNIKNLIKAVLTYQLLDNEYYNLNSIVSCNEIFGKMKSIISNYSRTQSNANVVDLN